MSVGIEAINVYAGCATFDVRTLFQARGLDMTRFENLMMLHKSVGLPCEDAVTHAVNAARPLIAALSPEERGRIDLVIAATESGIDFGKALSTYVHEHLGLARTCRLFEVKQACYAGTAALQMAAHYVAAQGPGARALVVATDVARYAEDQGYAEASQGVGAVAMLVSADPRVLALDLGASGLCSYQVMDTCRPDVDIETGDPDLSLLAYLECLEHSFAHYRTRVEDVDFRTSFRGLAFHTPFAGMVRGAHRKLMQQLGRVSAQDTATDFERRVAPSLVYARKVGNVYSASLYIALCSLISHTAADGPYRVGLFSYGSGCSSEFYSGVVGDAARDALARLDVAAHLDGRYALSLTQYEALMRGNAAWKFGIKDREVELDSIAAIYRSQLEGKQRLVLRGIANYHRKYSWS
jgi:polyketide biosynthesis 3-hydroxy-3-methylglutaryl-CoA synthase-like enzyme PksG